MFKPDLILGKFYISLRIWFVLLFQIEACVISYVLFFVIVLKKLRVKFKIWLAFVCSCSFVLTFLFLLHCWASLVAQTIKNLPAMLETQVWSLGQEISWRREWLPTPVFLPGEFHGQRRLEDCIITCIYPILQAN